MAQAPREYLETTFRVPFQAEYFRIKLFKISENNKLFRALNPDTRVPEGAGASANHDRKKQKS